MYTYKIVSKEELPNGVIKIVCDFFKDGVKIANDFCLPGDATGFEYWLKSKFKALETAVAIKTDVPVDTELPAPAETVVTPPVLTKEETDRNTWLEKYYRWVRIKTTVIDTDIIPISNTKAQALLADLKTTLKAEYLDFI